MSRLLQYWPLENRPMTKQAIMCSNISDKNTANQYQYLKTPKTKHHSIFDCLSDWVMIPGPGGNLKQNFWKGKVSSWCNGPIIVQTLKWLKRCGGAWQLSADACQWASKSLINVEYRFMSKFLLMSAREWQGHMADNQWKLQQLKVYESYS